RTQPARRRLAIRGAVAATRVADRPRPPPRPCLHGDNRSRMRAVDDVRTRQRQQAVPVAAIVAAQAAHLAQIDRLTPARRSAVGVEAGERRYRGGIAETGERNVNPALMNQRRSLEENRLVLFRESARRDLPAAMFALGVRSHVETDEKA